MLAPYREAELSNGSLGLHGRGQCLGGHRDGGGDRLAHGRGLKCDSSLQGVTSVVSDSKRTCCSARVGISKRLNHLSTLTRRADSSFEQTYIV